MAPGFMKRLLIYILPQTETRPIARCFAPLNLAGLFDQSGGRRSAQLSASLPCSTNPAYFPAQVATILKLKPQTAGA